MYKKNREKMPITSMGIINLKMNDSSIYKNEFNNIIDKIKNYNDDINIYNIIKTTNNINNKKLFYNILNDVKKNLMFLFVRKKNSIEYIEFIKGKYNVYNEYSYVKLLSYITLDELQILKNSNFIDLWNNLWNVKENNKSLNIKYENEYINSKDKFEKIDKSIYEKIKITYNEPEWGFPKGKKNKYESNLDCALREFNEETGINKIIVLNSIIPINEIFYGTNNIKYKHIYYISLSNDNNNIIDKSYLNECDEISDIEWYNYESSNVIIRSYHIKKKIIIMNIIKFISILP
jgi:ADP-ribose pyrophosphatase YjhB (NUDIX family)